MKAAFPAFVRERDCWTLDEGVNLMEAKGFRRFDSEEGSWVTLRKGALEALVAKNPHKKHLGALLSPFVISVIQLG